MIRRKLVLVLLALIPTFAAAQIKLGPFTFLHDSKASILAANLVLGGGVQAGITAEIPSLGPLAFFDFIPGYANRLFAASDGSSFYAEVAIISRARYMPKRKVVGLIGLGPGIDVASKSIRPTVSVFLGINYLLWDRYVLTLDVRSAGFLTVGIGWHNGFGWR